MTRRGLRPKFRSVKSGAFRAGSLSDLAARGDYECRHVSVGPRHARHCRKCGTTLETKS